MRAPFDRRAFLRGLLVSVAAGAVPACDDRDAPGDDELSTDPADRARVFPQGLASGDPSPSSVILWTRVEPPAGGGPVEVDYEVATDEAFEDVVATGSLSVSDSTDHTLRIRLTALEPYTTYHYRFVALGVQSIAGRTKTAPLPDADVSPRFAFASCQDYVGRFYHSYKALLADGPVDFVVFLGDYIYETDGDPSFQTESAERKVELPDGLDIGGGTKAALTLADYRTLYRIYRSDPDIQAVHAQAPFVCIWDDHEFANDCWRDHATDFNDERGDEKSPERRLAANRAWLEYQPADVGDDPADLRIYRTLRYGKHVELVLTDQRSYRDDHVIPEGALPSDKPEGSPDDFPTYIAAGKVFANSEIFSRNFVKKSGFDVFEDFEKPTMLGDEQKQWFLDAMKSSTATWKFWGSETQVVQMVLDLSGFDLPADFKGVYYFTVDQWDGFRTERRELVEALAGTPNVVVITGDIHGFYAAEIHPDPDAPGEVPVMVEYVTSGISSSPVQQIAQSAVDANPDFSALGALVPVFDDVLALASLEYKHRASNVNGISIVEVDADREIRVHFLEVADVFSAEPGPVTKKSFRTRAGTNRVEPID
jgi:alkaline phosphatase D